MGMSSTATALGAAALGLGSWTPGDFDPEAKLLAS